MACLPNLRPRRSDVAFHVVRFLTIALVVLQFYFIGRETPDLSTSGDITTLALYTARMVNLVALVPTVLACYLRPATLRRWSLAIGLLCGINIGLSVAIKTYVKAFTTYEDACVTVACLVMVVQAIYIGIRWFSYGPADYDEPVLRLETLNSESEGDSAPVERNSWESRVQSPTCAVLYLAQRRSYHPPPPLSSDGTS